MTFKPANKKTDSNPPVWQAELEELEHRRNMALEMGGAERVERQHAHGKLTVRERLKLLLDPDSFVEVGQLAGLAERREGEPVRVTPAPFVGGLGKIHGRHVAVGGEDFTVRGGSGANLARRKGGQGGFIEDMAREYRIPFISLADGSGADVASALKANYKRLPAEHGFERYTELLGMVPVVAGVLGSCAGGPAGRAMLSHFSVMVKNSAQIFAAGPPVVARALYQKVSKEELGGWRVAVEAAGSVDNAAESEQEAFAQIRRFLSYLPGNVWTLPPVADTNDPVERAEEELASIIPRKRTQPYAMRRLIELVVDRGSFFEIQPSFGRGIISGLARLGGFCLGVVANNPAHNGGAMDARDADKQSRLVALCDTFHIPLLFLVDVPGFMIGREAEAIGTLRAGMRAMHVGMSAKVPRLTVIVRKCYGMAGATTFSNNSLHYRIAWPSAEFGSLPVEGGVAASFRRQIEASPDPEAATREIEQKIRDLGSPFRTAEAFGVEDLIDPRETRLRLWRFLEAAQSYLRTESGPKPKFWAGH